MPELFSQKLKANFTPEQQDYYLQLENELKELLGGQTQEEVLAGGDPEIIQKILEIKQEMLNFVLTKKTREMVKQEEKEQEERILRQREKELEKERQAVSLDEIERKQKAGVRLTDNELKFLYRIDGFGLSSISSAHERALATRIIENRDIKQDIIQVLNCKDYQVRSSVLNYARDEDIEYCFESLYLAHIGSGQGLYLPKRIKGNLDLGGIINPQGLKLPESVGGVLDLRKLNTVENLKLPKYINYDLLLDGIITTKGLKLPIFIGGKLYLRRLRKVDELEIPLGVKTVVFSLGVSDAQVEKISKKFPHVTFERE